MDITADAIRTFVALCELRNFSKAAKKVFKSQSAVSTQIAALEERAGVKFFDRSERPLKLTEAGQVFLNFSREFLNRLEELDRFLKEIGTGLSGAVNVAASTSLGTYLLPGLIAEILKNSLKLNLRLSVQGLGDVCDGVRYGDYDFGLVLTDEPPKSLVARALRKEPLCLVVSPQHPIVKRGIISPEELRTVPFIGGVKGNQWTDMIEGMLKKNGVYDFPVGLRVNNQHAIKEAARLGLGVAVLPEFAAQREIHDDTLRHLNVKNMRLDVSIMLVERPRFLASPTVTTVKTFLEKRISAKAQ